MTMEEFEEASTIIHEKVHEDANIIVGLVIDESLGEKIKITAIATGFGENFDKKRKVTDVITDRSEALLRNTVKTDLDVPTHIRQQAPVTQAAPKQREMPSRNRDLFVDDEQFDIPTFLRRRVD
jgi:cell division protein FtsZ